MVTVLLLLTCYTIRELMTLYFDPPSPLLPSSDVCKGIDTNDTFSLTPGVTPTM